MDYISRRVGLKANQFAESATISRSVPEEFIYYAQTTSGLSVCLPESTIQGIADVSETKAFQKQRYRHPIATRSAYMAKDGVF